jgi:hypothetical protein
VPDYVSWLKMLMVRARRPGGVLYRRMEIAVAFSIVFCRFMPGWPFFPGEGLDFSWAWAVNAAASRGMSFGHDIVFTYGPYASLASRMYDPELRWLIIGGSALLGSVLFLGIKGLAAPGALIPLSLCISFVPANDPLFFVLPLPIMLICGRLTATTTQSVSILFTISLSAAALGLLPLIKLSFLPVSIVGVATTGSLLLLAQQRRLAAWFAALTLVSLVAWWCLAGQNILILTAYFRNGMKVAAGYAEAMGRNGSGSETIEAGVAVLALLILAVLSIRQLQLGRAVTLLSGLAALIFIVLKSGFVRQDSGHVEGAFYALGLIAAIIGAWTQRRLGAFAFVCGMLTILRPVVTEQGFRTLPSLIQTVAQQFSGADRLIFDGPALTRDYAKGVAEVTPLPWHPNGTSDIYSTGQARLLASGLPWLPRPVLQSYSAYTPALARMNAAHLAGEHGADNVFFRPEPIDGRLPALEDGSSWLTLLSAYEPAGFDFPSDLLWLRRTAFQEHALQPGPPVLQTSVDLGHFVTLPAATALWVELVERPTILGGIAGAFYKYPPVIIRLRMMDGAEQDYRFIPGMAESGFLMSPLVTSSAAFLGVRPIIGQALPSYGRRVAAFSLQVLPPDRWAWKKKYRLIVRRLSLPAAKALVTTTQVIPAATAAPVAAPGFTCFLDEVDGSLAPRSKIVSRGPILLKGWAAFDAARGIEADSAEFAFVSVSGAAWAVPVNQVRQDGIGAVFGHPSLVNVGMLAEADTSRLSPGDYQGEFILQHAGERRACATNLRITVPRAQ